MLLLNGSDINKSFSGETLFENVSFHVYDKDKIGFVGVLIGGDCFFAALIGHVDAAADAGIVDAVQRRIWRSQTNNAIHQSVHVAVHVDAKELQIDG